MGPLLLVILAAIWIAVLVPPLVRSRMENRPNSSVSDFRSQLSSLQRAMPARGVAVRTMGRSLAPSALARPAAGGRPTVRGAASTRNGQVPRRGRVNEASLRPRAHGDPTAGLDRRDVEVMALKRRRTNVLFALGVTAICSGFLAFTTDSKPVMAVFAAALVALSGYMYLLAQEAQRSPAAAARQAAPRRAAADRQQPGARRHGQAARPSRRSEGYADDRYGDPYDEVDHADDDRDVLWEDSRPAPAVRRRSIDPSFEPRRPAVAERYAGERRPAADEIDEFGDDDDEAPRRRTPRGRGKLTMPPKLALAAVGARDPLLPSWRVDEPDSVDEHAETTSVPLVAAAEVADATLTMERHELDVWRDDDTQSVASVGDGDGTTGRISYGRSRFSRLGGADGYTMPSPFDTRDAAARDGDRSARSIAPARNGRHATGQNPVLKRTLVSR